MLIKYCGISDRSNSPFTQIYSNVLSATLIYRHTLYSDRKSLFWEKLRWLTNISQEQLAQILFQVPTVSAIQNAVRIVRKNDGFLGAVPRDLALPQRQ